MPACEPGKSQTGIRAYLFRRRHLCRHHGVRRLHVHQWTRQRAQQHDSDLYAPESDDELRHRRERRTLLCVKVDLHGRVAAGVVDLYVTADSGTCYRDRDGEKKTFLTGVNFSDGHGGGCGGMG